ncbi:hypothetical protein HOJ01_03465 [bacterium]|jgi:hypothetical protein|nr:hypothetical protein [bacterium]MBT6293840.1 hypothetical protein [bacterium]
MEQKFEALNQIIDILNEKEQEVIIKRYGFDDGYPKTLQFVGENMYITRERVRQIQKKALQILRRVAMQTDTKEIVEIAEEIIKDNNNVITEKKLIELLKERGYESHSIPSFRLCLDLSEKVETIKKTQQHNKGYILKDIVKADTAKETIKKAIEELNNEKISVCRIKFENNLFDKTKDTPKESILSILELSTEIKQLENRIGLKSWRCVNPKSIKDKSILILNSANKPLHFKDIFDLIHEKKYDHKQVTIEAVHNELIRYEDFVLVGRGLYALKDWGYKPGTVKDVIKEILKEKGPLNKKEIVKEVLKKRDVQVGTISLNLQKTPEFLRVGRAIYKLEEK